VLTGGDVLMRPDLLRLVRKARELGLHTAVSPSVTPRLEPAALSSLREAGVKVASLSLDGAGPATHEGLRGVAGHFEQTVEALHLLRDHGFTVQVNTVVRPENVAELPEIAAIVDEVGASIWEVFFLVRVGRGTVLAELSPQQNEDVCHFLFDASRYGFIVRTVEAPFFRRVVAWRREGRPVEAGPLYDGLAERLRTLLGEPRNEPRAQTKGTRDGKGIVFVAHDGDGLPGRLPPDHDRQRPRGEPRRPLPREPRSCAISAPPPSGAAAAHASTPTSAAARGHGPTPRPAIRSAKIRPVPTCRPRPRPCRLRSCPQRGSAPSTMPPGPDMTRSTRSTTRTIVHGGKTPARSAIRRSGKRRARAAMRGNVTRAGRERDAELRDAR